jgi:hypothetical protein
MLTATSRPFLFILGYVEIETTRRNRATEAIRRLVELGLKAKGKCPPHFSDQAKAHWKDAT